MQGERYKTVPDEVRKYAMGHYGRLAATPCDEFLEKARIRPQDMSTARSGERLEPALPRLRQQLGASASDEDLLLAAFYEPSLLAPLKKPQPAYSFRTTPLLELLRYLDSKPDIQYAKVRIAGTEMTLSV
jgi:pyruvate/oxaloacetate carboxyltransferase